MKLTCSNCGKTNEVVGFFWKAASESSGATTNSFVCGFCGKTTVVAEDPAKVKEMK